MAKDTPIQVSAPFDPKLFRNALGRFATGVTVITTQDGDRIHGMTANAFISVSLNPPLVLVSLDNRCNMHLILPTTGRFGISVLAEDQEHLSSHFAGRPIEGIELSFVTREGVPVLDQALAYVVAHVVDTHPAGDHTLYIGHVDHFESRDGRPLLFYGGKYRQMLERSEDG
jgi:flavin reductase (DIM6/NTAB) family NADH-FMN oxidoreductase RutF